MRDASTPEEEKRQRLCVCLCVMWHCSELHNMEAGVLCYQQSPGWLTALMTE